MAYTIENQTLMYIIIAFFVVQLLVMRYYVQGSIEDNNYKNNKKVIKKLTGQIGATFDQYMGGNRLTGLMQHQSHQQIRDYDDIPDRRSPVRRDDMDSIEDPAEDVEEDVQEESDE